MGLCPSRLITFDVHGAFTNMITAVGEMSRNQQMENDLREDFYKERRTIKLLFLGASQSGKTTILKQIKLLHPMQNR